MSEQRVHDVQRSLHNAECHGEMHAFPSESGPGSTCACGKTVWISKAQPATKSEGPQAVNEPLEKSHKWPDR